MATRRNKNDKLHGFLFGRAPRLVALLATGILISPWIGWHATFAWWSLVLGWDVLAAPIVEQRLTRPLLQTNPPLGRAVGAAAIFTGAALFTLGWAAAWRTGSPEAAFIAGVWYSGTLLHGLFYFSQNRLDFIANATPATLIVVVMPWLMMPPAHAGAVTVVAVLSLLMVVKGRKDRLRVNQRLVDAASARAAAERANSAKSAFLASMSHELRTPLNAIIGYGELVEDSARAAGDRDTEHDASRINAAARHLLGLVNGVLDLAKIEAGRMDVAEEPVDVASLVADVAGLMRPLAARQNNRLIVALPEALRPTLTDAVKLRQCLINLVGNAAKFTRDGEITIAVSVSSDPPVLNIAVRDTGPGIAPQELETLFQPFVQTQTGRARGGEGAGLGLAITRRLIELIDGTVEATSALGRGATFTLRLPYRTMDDCEATPVRAAA